MSFKGDGQRKGQSRQRGRHAKGPEAWTTVKCSGCGKKVGMRKGLAAGAPESERGRRWFLKGLDTCTLGVRLDTEKMNVLDQQSERDGKRKSPQELQSSGMGIIYSKNKWWWSEGEGLGSIGLCPWLDSVPNEQSPPFSSLSLFARL